MYFSYGGLKNTRPGLNCPRECEQLEKNAESFDTFVHVLVQDLPSYHFKPNGLLQATHMLLSEFRTPAKNEVFSHRYGK